MNMFIEIHAGNLLRFAFVVDAFYSNAIAKYRDVECCEVLGLCKGNGLSVLSSRALQDKLARCDRFGWCAVW